MTVFKQRVVLEMARGLKAFLSLEAGLTQGQVPDREFLAAQVRRLSQQTRRIEERSKGQNEELRRSIKARDQQLADQRRRINELRARLNATNASARGTADREEETKHVVDRFHKLYYDASEGGGTWKNTYWMGVTTWKCPLDLWLYQEMIFDRRPDVIVETGTAYGGSALFLANVCDRIGHGRVITMDIEKKPDRPRHERIEYINGSSTAEEIVAGVREVVGDGEALVILDSDHGKDHVLRELEAYNSLIKEGGYLIVEDTNVNGHPVLPGFGPGPMEAVEEFLKENRDFAVDSDKEKFYMTFNPRGFLKRIR